MKKTVKNKKTWWETQASIAERNEIADKVGSNVWDSQGSTDIGSLPQKYQEVCLKLEKAREEIRKLKAKLNKKK